MATFKRFLTNQPATYTMTRAGERLYLVTKGGQGLSDRMSHKD